MRLEGSQRAARKGAAPCQAVPPKAAPTASRRTLRGAKASRCFRVRFATGLSRPCRPLRAPLTPACKQAQCRAVA